MTVQARPFILSFLALPLVGLALVGAAPARAQAPTIVSFNHVFKGGTDPYWRHDQIVVVVHFSKEVKVEGSPLLALTIGSQTRQARYDGLASGETAAYFRYQVLQSDTDTDGYGIPANALSLNGGAIKDAGDLSVDAVLTHAASEAGANHRVEGSQSPAPRVHQVSISGFADGGPPYKEHESVTVLVQFTRHLRVTGHPRVALTIGATTRYAVFSRLTGIFLHEALFSYTVQSSDSDADGISFPANAVSLNGGSSAGGGPPRAAIETDADCDGTLCRARTRQRVSFEDAGSGTVRSRVWDFGDGRTSRARPRRPSPT